MVEFSAVLLAGGRSSRMGRDKAFLEIDGRPLWKRQLQILRQLAPTEIFLAGPPRDQWSQAGVEIIADAVTDAGPLAGLVAALRRCTTSHLLVLAIDLPNMTAEFLQQLLSLSEPGKGAVPKIGDRFEPLAAIYPAACLPLAAALLRSHEYTLQRFAARALENSFIIAKQVSHDEEALFFNLNTPEDFAAINPRRDVLPHVPNICSSKQDDRTCGSTSLRA